MSLRESVRAALSGPTGQPAWPQGQIRLAVDDLIEAGRQLDDGARRGEPVDRAEAQEVVDSLSAYVASLPPDDRAEVARRLVAELSNRLRFTPTMQPRARA
jgi:hypothetical protein